MIPIIDNMNKFTSFLFLFLVMNVFSQDINITAYVPEYSDTEYNFSREFIKTVVNLHNARSNEKIILKYKEIKSFERIFKDFKINSDTILSIFGITITDKRKKMYDFSYPYFTIGQSLQTISESSIDTSNWKDRVKTVIVEKKTAYEKVAEDFAKKYSLKLKKVKLGTPILDFLKQENSEFAYIGDSNVPWYSKDKKNLFYIKEAPVSHYGILYPKGSSLKKRLDPVIKYFVRSTSFHKLARNYLSDNVQEYFKSLKVFKNN